MRTGLEMIVRPGMPSGRGVEWAGQISVCVPLDALKVDRQFVEHLYPLLRQPKFADRLGNAMVEANLGYLAQWLAKNPPTFRRCGVQAAPHLHFGLGLVPPVPSLVFYFSASAITEALGAVPRSALEYLLDLQGRLSRSDVPVVIFCPQLDPWDGLLFATVEIADLVYKTFDRSMLDMLTRSPALTDWFGETLLFAQLGAFEAAIASLPANQFDAAPAEDQFYHYGLHIDEERNTLEWGIHIAAVRAAIDFQLKAAAREGRNL
ncbi:MAG TPA: hypothetical protein VL171_12580 [Verrucomicrobiae bacterium]|nr:hypothetical protein [Verrucomicrobiae bacterium]